jgi:membrane protein implicated in regulation of membrane protease activity
MENYLWIFWAVLGAVLVIAEIFTTGFVLLWFGIGALAAGLAGLLGVHSIILQFLIFAVVSIGLTAASRTIFVNYFSREKSGGDLKSGVEALPGKVGTVVSSSLPRRWRRTPGSRRSRRSHQSPGRVDLCKASWRIA